MDQPIAFQNLGIARVKRQDIRESLITREKQLVDPFNQGFAHKETTRNVNLRQIRLCFQVWNNYQFTGTLYLSLSF